MGTIFSSQLQEITAATDQLAVEAKQDFDISILDIPLFQARYYYVYEGTTTKPPCINYVTHVVSSQPGLVSKDNIEQFRKLKAKDGTPLVDNFRPIQSHGRYPKARVARKFRAK